MPKVDESSRTGVLRSGRCIWQRGPWQWFYPWRKEHHVTGEYADRVVGEAAKTATAIPLPKELCCRGPEKSIDGVDCEGQG